MTTLSISPPFPIFSDRDGSPLENGYVWIGTANLNPITNPISVFWDAAQTQPAAQPVRTINGYPSNSGTPGRLYVNSDYSIQVQDAKGSLVYSAPAATDRFSNVVIPQLNDWVTPEEYGAVGNGTTVDTVALQAAINTGKSVRGTPNANYLTGPLTQSAANQVLDFTGCTVTRIDNSAHAAVVTLGGTRARVRGGYWDGNKANQAGTVNDQYAQAAVTITGDYCTVEDIESVNSWGIGVKGQACSYAVIKGNRCIDFELFGVFVETGAAADEYGNEILDNYVSNTSGVTALGLPSGIYITGTNDYARNQYFWTVSRNTVQLSQNASVTGICITTRAYDGVCEANVTTGGTMGISGDSATRSTFTANRCSDTAGASDYGIEINNALCTVVGNAIKNTRYGVSISSAVFNLNYATISGNVINPKDGGIGVYALGQVAGVRTITGATSANPIQFTFTGTAFAAGNFVTFTELPGNFSALNGSQYAVSLVPITDSFNGTGALTVFTLTTTPNPNTTPAVYVGGVLQTPTTNYTLVGTTLTFVVAPPAGTGNVQVQYNYADRFTVAVNGAAFAAYTSGGKALRGVAQYLNITGNTIKFNAPSALTGSGGACLYLAGRTEYSTVSGNLFVGCGSTIPSGIGVYLDNTGGYCSILGNKFTGLSEPVTLYSGTPSTFTDVSFNANDLTYDCPAPGSILTASGSATIGARVTQMLNATSGGVQTNIIDTATSRQISWSDGVSTPEGNVTGGLGSVFVNYGYGEGNTLYVKEAAGTNTGWIPVNSAYATFAQLNDATSDINTLRKRYGRLVTDNTNNRQYFASGSLAASPWLSLDGQLSLTPGSGAVGRGSFAARAPSDVNAANYTVAATDYSLRFTTTNCTVTLPTASSNTGRILVLNTITANSVTSNASNVIPLGSNTPGTAIFAATAGKFAMIQSDGTNWITLLSN